MAEAEAREKDDPQRAHPRTCLGYTLKSQFPPGNILVPKIMQKAVGLSPVAIIIALLVGVKLAGVLGALLAIPAAAGIVVVFYEWKKIAK